MKIGSFKDVFVEELRDIYHAEGQLVKALPKVVKAVQCDDLKEGLQAHFEETQGHVKRLEQIFGILGEPAKAKKCEAMEGLVNETKEALDAKVEQEELRDAMLILGAEKVEHYEIAAYSTLQGWARKLGHDDVAKLLNDTLKEEQAAADKLAKAALKHADTLCKETEPKMSRREWLSGFWRRILDHTESRSTS